MNDPVRRLSVVALILFLALMASSSWIQVLHANALNQDPRNVRTLYREFGTFRGPFIVDGEAIVYSQPVDDPFNYQRSYVDGPLWASATGFYSIVYGRTGLEQTENALLNGSADELFWTRLGNLISGEEQEGAAVELTLRTSIQQAAMDGLGDQAGAVVAIDPRTGAVLGLATSPTFDPAVLAGHDTAEVSRQYESLLADASDPLINRAISGDTYPPGSTFKLVVAAAALESGYSPDTEVYAPRELPLPGTSISISNYGGEACDSGDTTSLENALRISCNTAFADIGIGLGWGVIERKALEFGWTDDIQIPLRVTPSRLPDNPDAAQTAMSSIGQFDVRATPLQMAMVAAGIANDGMVMQPYLVDSVRGADLSVIERSAPTEYRRAMTPADANALTQMMITVVDSGTGRAAQVPGVLVAGKTGTAETGVDGEPPHAWFVAFAPAENPVVAVAVVVENGGSLGNEATGGRLAAPIARAVIEAALALENGDS